jgi:hypothetical protein
LECREWCNRIISLVIPGPRAVRILGLEEGQ